MKRDLKDIAVQLDNLNVPVVGFVFTPSKRNASLPRTAITAITTITTEMGKKSKLAHKNSPRSPSKTEDVGFRFQRPLSCESETSLNNT